MRRTVWEKNMKMIKDHNGEDGLGKNGFTMEMNEFGDMTEKELKKMLSGFQIQTHNKGENIRKRAASGVALPEYLDWRKDLPEFVDWQKKGYVTSVRHQRDCGSCWAFAATGAIEGQIFKKTGNLTRLSVQNLIDCSKPYGNDGCEGGTTNDAFQYVLYNGGLEAEATYPYERKEGPCRYDPKNLSAKIKEIVALPRGEDVLMDAVATKGPIATGINVLYPSFYFYKTGIYHEPNCNPNIINHAVLVVGYGYEVNETHVEKYWRIRNSWGKGWGLRGYMKIAKDWNNHCGISSYAQYPIV
ncbi:cathepsin Q-like [Sigmodon hispidus]